MNEQLDDHVRPTYNDIHNLIKGASVHIAKEFTPDLLIAIGISFCPFIHPSIHPFI